MKDCNKNNFSFYYKIFIFLFLIIISLNFVITGDDYYFLNTGINSLIDKIFFYSNNGRYLGNLFGIFISNLSKFTNL